MSRSAGSNPAPPLACGTILGVSEQGKRVAWVELYLDLIFVLAVGQLAHVVVRAPEMHSVWVALGLFATLWWTWVGLAVLLNRHGAETPRERLLFLAARIAYWMGCVGLGLYLAGARVFLVSLGRLGVIARVVLLVVTFQLGRLADVLTPREYVWLLAGWTVMCATLSTVGWRRVGDPVDRYLGVRADRR